MQIIINSLIEASELGLLAIGVTLVYDLLGFPNFAQVTFGTLGAYLCYFFAVLSIGIWPAAVLGVLLTGLFGVGVNALIFSKFRFRRDVIPMIASFGLAIVMRSVILAVWGASPQSYPVPLEPSLHFLGGTITVTQILIIGVSAACVFLFFLLLTYTKLGIALRATSDNSDLAEASGIETSLIIAFVWFLSSALGGLGGVMVAADTQLLPTMGLGLVIPVFAAAILGGLGSPYGAFLGALIVALVENVGLSINWGPLAHFIGLSSMHDLYIPVGYKRAPPFILLILILLFRPYGLVGEKS